MLALYKLITIFTNFQMFSDAEKNQFWCGGAILFSALTYARMRWTTNRNIILDDGLFKQNFG